MADYTVKRDGLWRFVRRVPKEYAALDQRKIVQHSTGVRVADDPRGIRARKIADNLNAALEAHWRDLVENRNAQAVRNYEAARQAARRLRISEPIADAAQRTIAELLDRIERLERKRDDRAAVLAVYDAAPKPGITFRQCAERFIEAHKLGSMYYHCGLCMRELLDMRTAGGDASPREYAQLEVGVTLIGLQVWCRRHEANVLHVDFEGRKHPANLTCQHIPDEPVVELTTNEHGGLKFH